MYNLFQGETSRSSSFLLHQPIRLTTFVSHILFFGPFTPPHRNSTIVTVHKESLEAYKINWLAKNNLFFPCGLAEFGHFKVDAQLLPTALCRTELNNNE